MTFIQYIRNLIDSNKSDNSKLFTALVIITPLIVIMSITSIFVSVPEFVLGTLATMDIALFGLGTIKFGKESNKAE